MTVGRLQVVRTARERREDGGVSVKVAVASANVASFPAKDGLRDGTSLWTETASEVGLL